MHSTAAAYDLVVMFMKQWLGGAAAAVLTLALLWRPELAAAEARAGLLLCIQTVIPSLFPFFAVISLLLRLGAVNRLQHLFAPFMVPLFHLRGSAAAPLLAGLLGGYPSGAKAAAELYEEGLLSKEEAEVCLGFVNNCGPAFFLSYIGTGMLENERLGLWLYLIHVLSALLSGMLLCRLAGIRPNAGHLPPRLAAAPNFPQMFTAAVISSFAAVLNICAFVILFRTAAGVFPAAIGSFLGFFELISGCAFLTPGRTGFVLAAALTGWGGLSVHCQTLAVIGPLSARWHLPGKTLQAVLSTFFAWILYPYLQ